jgi:transposase
MKYFISDSERMEASRLMKTESRSLFYRRLQVVNLAGIKTYEEIGKLTGYHPNTLSGLLKRFKSEGFEGLLKDGRKGGNHRQLTLEEENQLLSDYANQCDKGLVLHANTLWKDYEAKTGKSIGLSGFYRLLHRHGWRIIASRPQHPQKASPGVIEASKKLSPKSKKR